MRPQAGQIVAAVTTGSWSVAQTSIPVETPRPVAGQLIMMIPTIFSSVRSRPNRAQNLGAGVAGGGHGWLAKTGTLAVGILNGLI
jgi:hypothetical protein